VPSELSPNQLSQLAKLGARVRLAEIKRERAALNAILNGSASGAGSMQTASREPVRRRQRRATWSAAQRRAVSERMKRYWAKRRATAKKVHAKRITPA
jgi:hypothetical protein